jgi:hypothetical protein
MDNSEQNKQVFKPRSLLFLAKIVVLSSFFFLWQVSFFTLLLLTDIEFYKLYIFSLLMNLGVPLSVLKLPKYTIFLALPSLIFSTTILIGLSDGIIGWFEGWGVLTNFCAVVFLVYNQRCGFNKKAVVTRHS